MEKDNEYFTGAYDFGARIYDGRIGRWLSKDPKSGLQPNCSAYKAFLNNPIIFIDPDGETEYIIHIYKNESTGESIVSVTKGTDLIMTDGLYHTVKSWYDLDGSHKEQFYYDYSTTITTTYHSDGTITESEPVVDIFTFQDPKDTDWVMTDIQVAKPGKTKKDYTVEKDEPREVWFGFVLNCSKWDGEAVVPDKSKNVLGVVNLDWLKSMLARTSLNGGYSPPSAKWYEMDHEKTKHIIDAWKKESEKILEAVEETQEELKKLKLNPEDSVIIDYTKTNHHPSGIKGVPDRESHSSSSGKGVLPKDTLGGHYKGDKNTKVDGVRKK